MSILLLFFNFGSHEITNMNNKSRKKSKYLSKWSNYSMLRELCENPTKTVLLRKITKPLVQLIRVKLSNTALAFDQNTGRGNAKKLSLINLSNPD